MAVGERNVFVDCDAGRKLGCQTFCCRLLVRLKPHEMGESRDGLPAKGYVDKDPDGMCAHMDRNTWKCKIWEDRPQTCREYSCNDDFLLQVAVREEFANVVDLVDKASTAYIPIETYVKVPTASADDTGTENDRTDP